MGGHGVITDVMQDGRWLCRWVDAQDERAFGEIVARHQAMVRRVCLQLLGPGGDADDAAHLVFDTLARRAAALRDHPCLAGWLHRTSWQVAMRFRTARHARRRHETAAAGSGPTAADTPDYELTWLLHDELAALDASWRQALVLCHLEGHSHASAAALVGCPVGTIASRLSRARAALRTRLRHHGVDACAVMAALSATGLMPPAPGHHPRLAPRERSAGGWQSRARLRRLGMVAGSVMAALLTAGLAVQLDTHVGVASAGPAAAHPTVTGTPAGIIRPSPLPPWAGPAAPAMRWPGLAADDAAVAAYQATLPPALAHGTRTWVVLPDAPGRWSFCSRFCCLRGADGSVRMLRVFGTATPFDPGSATDWDLIIGEECLDLPERADAQGVWRSRCRYLVATIASVIAARDGMPPGLPVRDVTARISAADSLVMAPGLTATALPPGVGGAWSASGRIDAADRRRLQIGLLYVGQQLIRVDQLLDDEPAGVACTVAPTLPEGRN